MSAEDVHAVGHLAVHAGLGSGGLVARAHGMGEEGRVVPWRRPGRGGLGGVLSDDSLSVSETSSTLDAPRASVEGCAPRPLPGRKIRADYHSCRHGRVLCELVSLSPVFFDPQVMTRSKQKKTKKTPRKKFTPRPEKKAHRIDSIDPGPMNPAWKVSELEMCDPFGWHRLSSEEQEAILQRLARFESMTWNEILVEGRAQNHAVPVEKLATTARKRLQTLNLDDTDSLISLRVSSKKRIWGIKQHSILLLLW